MYNILGVMCKWLFRLLLLGTILGMISCSSGSNNNINSSNSKSILTFALGDTPGVITDHNITVTVPYGTDITSLIATFTTNGRFVTIGRLIQISGITKNDFKSPVTYLVHAANGSTKNYEVTVTAAAPIYSYITEHYNNTVTKCIVDANGNLNQCSDSGATALNFPTSIISNNAGSYIYITNQNNDTVTKCLIDTVTGNLSGCSNSGATNLQAPNSIVLSETGTYAYIINMSIINPPTVSKCIVNPNNGNLSECVNSGATGFGFPSGIAYINLASYYVYITDLDNEKVAKCTVNVSTGGLSDCVDSNATGLAAPVNIIFYRDSNFEVTYAYIVNYYGQVTKCLVNTVNGSLSECVNSGATGLQNPKNIILNKTKTYAYITNQSNNTVSKCLINATNGNLSGCTDSGATGLQYPDSITVIYPLTDQ